MNLNLTNEPGLLCDIIDAQATSYEQLAETLDSDNQLCDAAQRAMKALRAASSTVRKFYEVYNAQQIATGN